MKSLHLRFFIAIRSEEAADGRFCRYKNIFFSVKIDTGKAFLKASDFPLMIVGIIVDFVPAILYLLGARRNRPAGEQIEVENR